MAWKAATRAVAEQPVPVTAGMSGWPPSTSRVRSPSVTRSILPVTASVVPRLRASSRAASVASVTDRVASTPLVRVSAPASARISEALPRTTLTRVSASRRRHASVRRRVAPAPTGSSTMGRPSSDALRPALTMAASQVSVSVPMLSTRAPARATISSTSLSAWAITGEAPAARRTLAV